MTIKEAFSFIKQNLTEAGVDNPAFDAIYLFEHVLSMSHTDLMVYGEKDISTKDVDTLNTLAKRRISGEPIQYILGYWYFYGRKFYVSKGVLIPRDDTEVLTRACINIVSKSKAPVIMDLCSGSGIVAITLQKELKNSEVYAVEKSKTAFEILQKNCTENDAVIKTVCGDLYDCAEDFSDGTFDMIVSNPPYIISSDIASLQKEVQYEPKMALDGGADGYDFYRGIIKLYSKKIKKGGYIAFEIGEGQFEYISQLLKENGFSDIKSYLDLSLTPRAVSAIYNS